MKKITISDIARLARVSRTTVSYVLNAKGKISPEVIARVREAMRRTEYRPRARAARPSGGRALETAHGAVAVVFPPFEMSSLRKSWGGEYVDLILHGCELKLREYGLRMAVARMLDGSPPEVVTRRQVDGAIVVAVRDPIVPEGLPVVHLFDPRSSPSVDLVTQDNDLVGRMAAECLIAKGCRHVAFVNTEPEHLAFASRLESFSRALREAGRACRLVEHDPGRARGASPEDAVLRELLRVKRRPDGLFMPGSDAAALALYTGLLAAGVHPGRHVTFVCCLNSGIHLETLKRAEPIDIRVEEQARMSVDILVWRLLNRSAPAVQVQVEPRMWR